MLIGFSGGAVFHAQATEDNVIPRELRDATWTYLSRGAGANAVTHCHPGATRSHRTSNAA